MSAWSDHPNWNNSNSSVFAKKNGQLDKERGQNETRLIESEWGESGQHWHADCRQRLHRKGESPGCVALSRSFFDCAMPHWKTGDSALFDRSDQATPSLAIGINPCSAPQLPSQARAVESPEWGDWHQRQATLLPPNSPTSSPPHIRPTARSFSNAAMLGQSESCKFHSGCMALHLHD